MLDNLFDEAIEVVFGCRGFGECGGNVRWALHEPLALHLRDEPCAHNVLYVLQLAGRLAR